MEYTQKTVTLRWGGELRTLGTLDCPTNPQEEGAETAFLAEAVLAVRSCYDAFDAELPPQPKFLLVIRALTRAYVQNGCNASLENRLAAFYMKLYWEDWCKLMDPDGRHGPPPPPPATN